ncbi:glycosyltransferase family 2 protein [Puniceicoccus vermicola]|uniref:Glycosyltransferase n=1 Tax=Puniceicoccus vermicola TaxID=388746 RepID=A0A7X1E2J8_9BACT|nr:glycosyltransferase [Puniceicoccus vermicola]MBC2600545.1 glycosyltransferase [Puniceicoccus vermicola]
MKSWFIRLSLLLAILLFMAVAGLAVWLLIERTDHTVSKWLATAAFSFVIIFVSVLILRVLFFAFFAMVHLFVYRRGLASDDKSPRWEGRNQPKVSIIVPAYNEEKVIAEAIRSHLRMDYSSFEIVVVDDGSTDKTTEMAQQVADEDAAGRVQVHKIPNGGKGNALNYGIRVAKSEFLLCVDADSRLDPDSLNYAVRHMKDPRVAAVAGNVKVLNRHKILTNLQALEYIIGQNLMRRIQGLFRCVGIVPGPFGLFRRSAIEQVGLYTDDTFAEDCDLSLRLLASGWRIVDEINSVVRTEAPEKLKPFIKQRYRWTRGVLQALRKHKHGFTGRGGIRLWFVLINMFFDGVIWPVANLLAHACVFYLILEFGLVTYLVFWWIHFTLLDMGLALVCIASERETARLVIHILFYRLFFLVIMDVCKLLSSFEEVFQIKMGWGKLERTGSGGNTKEVPVS